MSTLYLSEAHTFAHVGCAFAIGLLCILMLSFIARGKRILIPGVSTRIVISSAASTIAMLVLSVPLARAVLETDSLTSAALQPARTLATFVLGIAFTVTTSPYDVLRVALLVCKPLRSSELSNKIAVSFGLVLRNIQAICTTASLIEQAHKARGVRPQTTTVLRNLIPHVMRDMERTASALTTRGIIRQ